MTSNISPLNNSNTNYLIPNSPFEKDSSSKYILQLVCFYLDAHDLVQLTSTSHHLYSQIYSDSALWGFLLQKCFPGFSLAGGKNPLEAYKRLTFTQPNIRAGIYRLQTLKGHQSSIGALLVHKNQLISASDDCTIKIWDMKSGEVLKTLEKHQGSVNCILMNGDQLISASDDCTIKIWDLENGEVLQTLVGHEDRICSIVMHKGKLISGSKNGVIKIWNIANGEPLQTIKGTRRQIHDLLMHGDKLIVAAASQIIRIWDVESGQQINTLLAASEINAILMYEERLVSASANKIDIWDLESGKELQTLEGHQNNVICILEHQSLLISASEDCTIRIWDLKTGKALQTLKGHEQCINDILMHDGMLISASKDHTIKIWDFGIPFSSQVAEKNLPPLEDQNSEGLHSLLAELGITTEECSEKLNCTPDFLAKVGILSIDDVKTLCLPLPGIQHLKIAAEEATEDNNLLQTQAFAKKDSVTNKLQTLLSGVNQRLKETENCTVLLYEGDNPWALLQEKLNGCLATLEMQCQTRQSLLKKFNPENYAKIVEEVNALIDGFETVEREHQITLLRTYAAQWGLLKAWNTLHAGHIRIDSLAALLQQPHLAPRDLFAMGE